MPDRIWIWFADNGNIRKWQSTPFDEGTEYVPATALADRDAKIAELERECRQSMETIAWERRRAETAESEIARLRDRLQDTFESGLKSEAQVAELTQKLERATALIKRIPAALSDSFSAGVEEREGGSWRRQERYSVSVDALRNDARAFLNSGASQNG